MPDKVTATFSGHLSLRFENDVTVSVPVHATEMVGTTVLHGDAELVSTALRYVCRRATYIGLNQLKNLDLYPDGEPQP